MHVGDLGFHYRKHGPSMLTRSRVTIDGTRRQIEARHPATFTRAGRPSWSMPTSHVSPWSTSTTAPSPYLSSPDLDPHVIEDLPAALDGYRPPVVVLVRADWLAEVRHLRLWHQVLTIIQESVRHNPTCCSAGTPTTTPTSAALHFGPGAATISGIAVDATRAQLDTSRSSAS